MYVIGGSDGTQSLATTEMYDPIARTWSPGPNMTTPRANVGAAVVGNRLYAVGGFSGKLIKSLLLKSSNLIIKILFSIKFTVIIFIGKKFLNSIEFLDESMDEWTRFSPKVNCSKSASPLPTNDSIYNYECDFVNSPSSIGML